MLQPLQLWVGSMIRKQQKLQTVVILGSVIFLILLLAFAEPVADWLDRWAFIQILDAVSKLSVLIAVAAFLLELPKREERAQAEKQRTFLEYWKIVDAAAASQKPTSHARKIALERLAGAGVSLRNIDAPKAELRKINLTEADLVGANFAGADLTGAILDRADLSKAYLVRSRLYGTSFRGAELLYGLNLRDALYDRETKFPDTFDPKEAGAILIAPGASLHGVHLPEAKFWEVDLRDADAEGANLSGASFPGANLQNVSFIAANLRGATFRSAKMDGANLKDADVQGAVFWKTQGLTVEQIKEARNWESAKYSRDLALSLGLKETLIE